MINMKSDQDIGEFSVVAVVHDLPERELVTGQVGTVVAGLGEGVFEVDFCDNEGRSYASVALKQEDLIVLHYSPVAA